MEVFQLILDMIVLFGLGFVLTIGAITLVSFVVILLKPGKYTIKYRHFQIKARSEPKVNLAHKKVK